MSDGLWYDESNQTVSAEKFQVTAIFERSLILLALPSPTTISKIAHLKRGAFFLQWGRRSRCKPWTMRSSVESKHLVRQHEVMCVSEAKAIHLPTPFTCSTVCKDGFFVLKLPLLQQFFHLAEKRWKDWLCSTNIPQFAHICGKSPSTMSEVQKWSVIVKVIYR